MPSATATQARHLVSEQDPQSMPATRWWRVFPGAAAQLRMLGRWIEDLLPPFPARDDVIEVACELAGNAICHTRSRQGGEFGVRVEQGPGVVSVTVADGGGESEPRLVADPLAEHGRGLRIVHALSARVTVMGGASGRLVRADMPWTGSGGTEPSADEGLAMLQNLFPGVPVWFGRATRQWWAVVVVDDSDRLIGAPSSGELAMIVGTLHGRPSDPQQATAPPHHGLRQAGR